MTPENATLPVCVRCDAVRTGFCATLGDDLIEEFCGETRLRRYCAGADIVAAGMASSPTMIVREGIVSVICIHPDGRRQVLDLLFPGDLLFIDVYECHESCQFHAASPVAVCEIAQEKLIALGVRQSEIGEAIFTAMLGGVARKNRQLLHLGRNRADERVASFLIDYGRRMVNGNANRNSIKLDISRGAIADFLCLTRETISRSFTTLREAGLIHFVHHDEIEIADVAALSRRARGDDLARPP